MSSGGDSMRPIPPRQHRADKVWRAGGTSRSLARARFPQCQLRPWRSTAQHFGFGDDSSYVHRRDELVETVGEVIWCLVFDRVGG